MQTQMIKTIISITSAFLLLSQAHVFAKGGGGGGVGNCNGNGNIKHGCGSSVITPDVLTQTSQGNARQPTAPIPTANQLPPQPPVTPLSPPLVPPMVPQPKPAAPPLAPPLVPQQVPVRQAVEGTPIEQRVPDLPPPQRTDVVTSPALVPQAIVVEPPRGLQEVPMATPPLVPQQVPVRQAVEGTPIEQRVPDLPPPQRTDVVTSPALVPQAIVVEPPRGLQEVPMATPPLVPPMAPQPKPTAPPLAPKMIPQAVPPTVSSVTPMFVASPLASPQLAPEPKVEVTLKASSAGFNRSMISNIPGRQPADSYAIFRNDATGVYRECVVSGLERRKVILPNGEIIYRGTLPSLRTVSNELSDIPSWHPHEAGCIISIEHKKR